jgi:hypothetical protein
MAKSNREYAIVVAGLALGILISGVSLTPFASAEPDTSPASLSLTLRNDMVSAFECKKGPDGTYDWDIAEPRTKAFPGAGTFRSAVNAPVPDLSPRHTGSIGRIKQEPTPEQVLPQRTAEKSALETKLCDAGQGANRHG